MIHQSLIIKVDISSISSLRESFIDAVERIDCAGAVCSECPYRRMQDDRLHCTSVSIMDTISHIRFLIKNPDYWEEL